MEYRHVRDPLFIVAIVLYCLNKFILQRFSLIDSTFIESYFSDFLLIPILLPILIWMVSKAGWRTLSHNPSHWEIIATLVPVIVVCEYIGPFYLGKGVADPFDILAYATGGFISWLYWKFGSPGLRRLETVSGNP